MVDVTRMLQDVSAGLAGADETLAAALYEDLRAIARQHYAGEQRAATLQPTAIVHEAWMRLFGNKEQKPSFANRAHFFAAAAQAIRRVLIDHARRRSAQKRCHPRPAAELVDEEVPAPVGDDDLLAVDEAIQRLATFAPEQARLVELRFFAGMTTRELAAALGASESTIERQWRSARAWLRTQLAPDTNDEA